MKNLDYGKAAAARNLETTRDLMSCEYLCAVQATKRKGSRWKSVFWNSELNDLQVGFGATSTLKSWLYVHVSSSAKFPRMLFSAHFATNT